MRFVRGVYSLESDLNFDPNLVLNHVPNFAHGFSSLIQDGLRWMCADLHDGGKRVESEQILTAGMQIHGVRFMGFGVYP
jgi:hypothetical protein